MTLEIANPVASPRLARNSVGLAHIVFFVVAAAAPLTAVVGASPVAFAFGNGAGVPGAYLLAGLLYLVFSVGFTAMSRHVEGAGAFYAYISQGIGRPTGVGAALMALITYSAVQIAIYALFGVFVAAGLAPYGIEMPWWVWSFAALAVVHLCGQRNIAFSGKILGVCMVAEIVILLLLDVGILIQGGGPEGIGLTSFAPATVLSPGLGAALVFVIGSFIGFEATAIFGEEAENPETTIPKATYVAVLLITLFYAFSTWAIVQHYGASQVQAVAEAGLDNFFFAAMDAVLGRWASETMNILLITSLFACVLSFHNTLNRYFFALGREGLAMRALGRVHEKHLSPHIAGVVQSVSAAAILLVFVVSGADPYAVVFSWMSALAVIGILSVQALVSVAIVLYFHRHPDQHGRWTTLVAPSVAFVGLLGALALVINNLSLLSGSDSPVVASFPYAIVLVCLAGILFGYRIKAKRPDLYAGLGRMLD
ncbi:APC family permease [Afifella marina]|uniref:Amino acid transporter n=1 Tax=Afifella marina DSM 2698 TaxID=1120955 RepID=A0A1G5NVK8_AFIMA|nr:APC family permease [Afifella marina]MBK1624130.1 APC family permease [Afifella marina DSM 2698]MBK1627687.1 APC family permease [Afifella marina]MBK5916411.1 amino acid permease [Afifella marina]RAI20967.1 amino acid permease [Afifella marina DSM 2698]SCZ40760.1 Amino acid transporter [Afifella marina DSM 2698]